MKKKKIGLVLGGGGAKGLAHVGALKALAAAGIEVDYVAGASIGAIVGAHVALGRPLEELEAAYQRLNKLTLVRELIDIGNLKHSVLGGKKLRKFLTNLYGGQGFADCKLPFACVATSLSDGLSVAMNKGDLIDAVMASSALPGLFPPVPINGRFLIDGGASNITPIKVVKEMGADLVIAVDLSDSKNPEIDTMPSLFDTVVQSYTIVRGQSVGYQLAGASEHADVFIAQPHFQKIINVFSFDKMVEFVNLGHEAMEEILPAVKKHLQ